MNTRNLSFSNQSGVKLSAKMDMPANQHPYSFAIFAHCFTCNKNLKAINNISRALTLQGIAVLRFDFAGLGESEGEFSDTNFSANIDDLLSAASFLEQHYAPPELVIGHSLGGAASIYAASKLESVKAVATIGAPSSPDHVTHLLKEGLTSIQNKGEATVNIGGRDFTIKKQFLDDLRKTDMKTTLAKLKKALLVLHSPQDSIVGINNAREIYDGAKHPKSFISLDGSDHLLSNAEDSDYAGQMIGIWTQKYLPKQEALSVPLLLDTAAKIKKEYTTEIQMGRHFIVADEPKHIGGNDFGPSPYDLLNAALAACTSITLRMYANRKNFDVDEINVHVSHKKDYVKDIIDSEEKEVPIYVFERQIAIEGSLSDSEKQRMLHIAGRCPVHQTLEKQSEIHTRLL